MECENFTWSILDENDFAHVMRFAWQQALMFFYVYLNLKRLT
jgi:hypothetical protein